MLVRRRPPPSGHSASQAPSGHPHLDIENLGDQIDPFRVAPPDRDHGVSWRGTTSIAVATELEIAVEHQRRAERGSLRDRRQVAANASPSGSPRWSGSTSPPGRTIAGITPVAHDPPVADPADGRRRSSATRGASGTSGSPRRTPARTRRPASRARPARRVGSPRSPCVWKTKLPRPWKIGAPAWKSTPRTMWWWWHSTRSAPASIATRTVSRSNCCTVIGRTGSPQCGENTTTSATARERWRRARRRAARSCSHGITSTSGIDAGVELEIALGEVVVVVEAQRVDAGLGPPCASIPAGNVDTAATNATVTPRRSTTTGARAAARSGPAPTVRMPSDSRIAIDCEQPAGPGVHRVVVGDRHDRDVADVEPAGVARRRTASSAVDGSVT